MTREDLSHEAGKIVAYHEQFDARIRRPLHDRREVRVDLATRDEIDQLGLTGADSGKLTIQASQR